MKIKLLISLVVACLNTALGQPSITDLKEGKEVNLCLYVSLKDTINSNNNAVFFGILEPDTFFKKFINKQEAYPTFYSWPLCKNIEKRINSSII
jgi:hypothetical protein